MGLDRKGQTDDFVEKFKLQLVGSDPAFWMSKLFPEFFAKGKEDDSFYNLDVSDVEWKMPEMTEEMVDKMMADMLANEPSPMTFTEYEDQQEDW